MADQIIPLSFRLPIPRSNELHLELFAEEGARHGADKAERINASLRQAARAGVATVRKYEKQLKAFMLAAELAQLVANLDRLSLRPEATFTEYLVALARLDFEETCSDLRRRGYHENCVARFRVSAWRAFKLAIREAGRTRH
jgi:hypothetical protein